MIANSQRIQILARRFELVREYAALHSERMELHLRLASLSSSRLAEAHSLTHGPLPAVNRAKLRELHALSKRLHNISMRAQGILLEQRMLLHALTEDTPPV